MRLNASGSHLGDDVLHISRIFSKYDLTNGQMIWMLLTDLPPLPKVRRDLGANHRGGHFTTCFSKPLVEFVKQLPSRIQIVSRMIFEPLNIPLYSMGYEIL